MPSSHRLVVHGAAGRMGQRIIACAVADTVPWQLVAAIERTGHPRLGADAGSLAGIGEAGVAISDGYTMRDLGEIIHAHPTISEMVMDAAQQGEGVAPYLS